MNQYITQLVGMRVNKKNSSQAGARVTVLSVSVNNYCLSIFNLYIVIHIELLSQSVIQHNGSSLLFVHLF